LADYSINKRHDIVANRNKYGFNDINHLYNKDPLNLRIAILGDSFVWGHGVEDSVRWNKRLEQKLKAYRKNVKVLHWGQNAWSTNNELDFLIEEGYKYEPDILIVGFVLNDPMISSSYDYYFLKRGGFVYRNIVYRFPGKLFGNSLSFIFDYLSALGASWIGISYISWLDEIYSDDNLLKYENILKDFKDFCASKKIDLYFVLTPENHSEYISMYFNKIIPILQSENIKYINTYEAVSNRLKDVEIRSLWANPANNHPGLKVTEVIADTVYKYILNRIK
jgi:hypothetical protein